LSAKADLALGFLVAVELVHGVARVDHGDHGVEHVVGADFFVDEEGLRHRARIGQAGGFDDDAVELQFAGGALARQVASATIRSPRTVQQMQPLFISTICSPLSCTRISLSMFSWPNSFSMTAMRRPCSPAGCG
jgi:hypothetical protein